MYKKIIFSVLLVLVSFLSYAQPSQYTPMTAAGYQFKRILTDSTLHLPSFCGVPNLRNSTAKNGALAIDTCNYKLYQWTNGNGWKVVAIDTTSLSNRINLKLNISDTSAMLSNYATDAQVNGKIDSLKRSSDSVYAYKNGQWVFQYKDSTGGGSIPTLQQVLNSGNTATQSGGTNSITLTDNSGYSSSLGSTGLQPTNNNDNSYGYYGPASYFLHDGTSQNMTGGVADNGSFLDVANVYGNKINLTSEQTTNVPYLSWFNNQDGITQKLLPQYSLANSDIYMPYANPTDTLATLYDIRNNKIDTANKFVNQIYRTAGVDSIYYKIGSTTYAIKDSIGTGGGQNGRFGNDTATIVMAKVHNDAGVTLTNGKVVAFSTSGTSSNAPSVKLANNKADSTSATTFGFVSGTIAVNDTGWVILSGKIEKLNTSAFANGDIIYLDSISGQWTKSKPVAPYHLVYLGTVVKANAGNGSIYVKVQNGYELEELHNVKITSPQNNQVLAYSDTQQLWKNRNIYSIVDTTTTVATKSNVALKLNISDSASMLNPYLRKIDTTNKFVNTITRTVGKDSIIFYIGGTRYAIKDSTGGGGGSAAGSTGYVQFNNAGTFAADSSLFWDNTNKRLGIGTTSPVNSLQIKGALSTNATSTQNFGVIINGTTGINSGNAGFQLKSSTGNSDNIFFSADNLAGSGIAGFGIYDNKNAKNLVAIQSNAPTNSFYIFSTGNTSIGYTSPTDAGYKLDVNGTGRFSSDLTAARIGGTNIGASGQLQALAQSVAGSLTARTTNAAGSYTPLFMTGSNLGTAGTLQLNYETTNQLSFSATNASALKVSRAAIGIASLTNTAGAESGDLTFLTQSGGTAMSEKMRIFGNGNVGIGTGSTDNGWKLQVEGTTRLNGNVQILSGSNLVLAGNSSTTNRLQFGTTNQYKTTNAGSAITSNAGLFFNGAGSNVYGFAFDISNPNGFVFCAGNSSTTQIARAAINITNLTNTAGSESGDMIFLTQSGGTAMSEKMRITSGGGITLTATNTAAGTTGNQTINKPSGTVNIAAAGTSITVTNSLVTTSSIVFAVIRTNDATATIKNVVPASGSFTINLNAAATAETSIGFFVIN